MKKKIISIIKDHLAFEEKVTEKSAMKALSLDSLSFIKILVTLEDTFNIFFTDDELNIKKFRVVDDLINLVKRKCLENEKNSM